jgi:hypothetical protein
MEHVREQSPIRLRFDVSSAGLCEQRVKQPEHMRPLFRRDKEFNDRWPLAPWTGDGLRAESREITLDVKRKHLRPTLPHVNLVIENLAPHLGAIALSQWEHGSRRAWHGFKSHASQLQLTNAPMARERWTRLMRLFPRDPLPMGILKTDE